MPDLLLLTGLSGGELAICFAAVFLAGCVRGFAGFGLSAVSMACLVLILPPVELIPVLYMLEASASLAMFRGGLRDAQMSQVWPLAIGSFAGVPLGLLATTSFSPDLSKLIAVLLILSLTILQFFSSMPPVMTAKPARYAAGAMAGIATGLASVGGMVVALYVLASRSPAQQMRASLTMFLFIGMFTSLGYMLLYGVMTQTALMRGLLFIPATILGVVTGTWAFNPRLQVYYKTFCLYLLIAICLASLSRLIFSS